MTTAHSTLEVQNLEVIRSNVQKLFQPCAPEEARTPPQPPVRITPGLVLDLHRKLWRGIPDRGKHKTRPGEYRRALDKVRVNGKPAPVDASMVPGMMDDLCREATKLTADPAVFELRPEVRVGRAFAAAGRTHYKFVYIHPFCDGNGRVSRLFADIVLANAMGPLPLVWKFPPGEVLRAHRDDYIRVLDHADTLGIDAGADFFSPFYEMAIAESALCETQWSIERRIADGNPHEGDEVALEALRDLQFPSQVNYFDADSYIEHGAQLSMDLLGEAPR